SIIPLGLPSRTPFFLHLNSSDVEKNRNRSFFPLWPLLHQWMMLYDLNTWNVRRPQSSVFLIWNIIEKDTVCSTKEDQRFKSFQSTNFDLWNIGVHIITRRA
ncbi:hypothetical protein GCK32_002904, partial [Trichostrongylus colubriformis]